MNSLIKYKIKKSKTFGKCQDSPFMCTVVSHQVVGCLGQFYPKSLVWLLDSSVKIIWVLYSCACMFLTSLYYSITNISISIRISRLHFARCRVISNEFLFRLSWGVIEVSGMQRAPVCYYYCPDHQFGECLILHFIAVKDQQPANVETNQHQQLMEAKAPNIFVVVKHSRSPLSYTIPNYTNTEGLFYTIPYHTIPYHTELYNTIPHKLYFTTPYHTKFHIILTI